MENQAIPVCEKVFFDKVEKDFEFDAVLPEYYPNIARTVKLDAYPKIESKTIEQNNIVLEGVIIFKLIYISDFKDKMKCINFSSDFTHSFSAPGIAEKLGEEGILRIYPYANSVISRMVNPRKLVFKSKVTIFAEASNCDEIIPYQPQEDQNMELLYENIISCRTIPLSDTSIKISEDIVIENEMPPIGEIIFADATVYIEEIKPKEQISPVQAYALVKCLYESETGEDGTSEYVAFEKKIPINGEIEFDAAESPFEIVSQPRLTSLSAEPSVDTYGENRIITCHLSIDLSSTAYKNDTFQICSDGFSTDYISSAKTKPFPCEQLVKTVGEFVSFTESVKVDLKNVSDIIETFADFQLLNTTQEDNKIILNGKSRVSVLGSNAEGEIEAFDTSFPITLSLQTTLPEYNGDLRFICQSEPAGVECHVENGELVVSVILAVRCTIFHRVSYDAVYEIEEDLEFPHVKCPGEMTIYYPEKEDNIWSVSKKYGISPDKIKQANKNIKETFEDNRIVIIPCFK